MKSKVSGHSKWKTIKHKKGLADAKRGQAFTKIAKIITIAAREGGGDPEANFKLRLAMEKARGVNMPKDNIQRAIDRGIGKTGGESFKQVIYEGFGPEGTAFLVEVTTDNTNRTNAEIRNVFSKNGGNLSAAGSVSYLFERCGYFLLEVSEQEQEAKSLEVMEVSGVNDLENGEQGIEVYTVPEQLSQVREELTQKNFIIKEAEMMYKPKTVVKISNKTIAERLIQFAERVEEHDDVQKIYANFDIPDELLE